jgi:hypothetical protein
MWPAAIAAVPRAGPWSIARGRSPRSPSPGRARASRSIRPPRAKLGTLDDTVAQQGLGCVPRRDVPVVALVGRTELDLARPLRHHVCGGRSARAVGLNRLGAAAGRHEDKQREDEPPLTDPNLQETTAAADSRFKQASGRSVRKKKGCCCRAVAPRTAGCARSILLSSSRWGLFRWAGVACGLRVELVAVAAPEGRP